MKKAVSQEISRLQEEKRNYPQGSNERIEIQELID
jgi:hypothetical protein